MHRVLVMLLLAARCTTSLRSAALRGLRANTGPLRGAACQTRLYATTANATDASAVDPDIYAIPERAVDEAEAGFHQGVRNLREVGREVRRDLPPRERRGPQAENSPDAASNEQQLRDFFAALDAVLSEEEGAEVGKGEVLGWRLHRAGGEVLDAGLARWRSPLTTRTRL